MAKLKDIPFSDLILSDGRGALKGIPGYGARLKNIDDPEIVDSLAALPDQLQSEMLRRKEMSAIRFEFEGMLFRACYADDVKSRAWFLRRISDRVPDLEELKIPEHILKYLLSPKRNRGLYLFTGAQTSGKTTLASSLIATRLKIYGGHCVTFESPAEMPLHGQYGDFGRCIQTEIDTENELPMRIMRAHTYASPDIIFIGEIKTAVSAVEALRIALGSNNQMVVATVHGISLEAALQRLLNWSKETEGDNAALNLSMSLSAVVHMTLKNTGNDEKVLEIPQFLLIPFKGDFSDQVRARLKTGQLTGLADDIQRQRAMILRYGPDVFLADQGG